MEYIRPMGIPVIFLTAKDSLKDRMQGLTSGAEDYMVKPFEVVELLARVNIVLRRYHKMEQKITFMDIELDSEANPDASVIKAASEGDKLVVDTQTDSPEGWVAVSLKNSTAFVSADYVTVSLNVASAVSMEEERAALEEKAA